MSEGAFEAKVERRSENKAGIFITFLVQPDDHDTALAQLRVGASVQIGWAEIVNTSVEKIEIAPVAQMQSAVARGVAGGSPAGGAKLNPKGGDLNTGAAEHNTQPLPAPVATAGARSKERQRFSDLKPSAQAGMRCADAQFRRFLAIRFHQNKTGIAILDADTAADTVRAYCRVESRRQFDSDERSAAEWGRLNSEFEGWLTTQQHGALAR